MVPDSISDESVQLPKKIWEPLLLNAKLPFSCVAYREIIHQNESMQLSSKQMTLLIETAVRHSTGPLASLPFTMSLPP